MKVFVVANTPTPTTASSKSLSQQFLEDYISDPTKNPYGQFYKTAYTGQQGGLTSAFEKYGEMPDPEKYAETFRAQYSDPNELLKAARNLKKEQMAERAANYDAYKQTYGKAEELFRQQRAAGFASPEEEERARQGLAAVREATFQPYLDARGYLETQHDLERAGAAKAAGQVRREQRIEMLRRHGMSEENIRKSLEKPKAGPAWFRNIPEGAVARARYEAVKDIGRGGQVTMGDRMSLGESLQQMMRRAGDVVKDTAFRKAFPGPSAGGGAGYASRPDASKQASVTPSSGGATTRPSAPSGPIQSLDVSRGGSATRFNMADLRAAREQGYGDAQIREYLEKNPSLIREQKRQRIMGALGQG